MKIIIVGGGKVGYAIARDLSQEKQDVILVDQTPAALVRADSTLDLMTIEGNGASIRVLMSAGVKQADLVLAVTGKDEVNLICCLLSKKLGAKRTVARVRNPEYRADADMLKAEIGLDMVINPDRAAALEIARVLSFPNAFSVEPFARGRVDMIGFQVLPSDTLCGVTLAEWSTSHLTRTLICAAEHEGDILIPNGSFVPAAGDKLYMVGTKQELQNTLATMGRTEQKVKTLSILGGSHIATYLTWELEGTGINVRIVEQDHDKCLVLAEALPRAMIIEGDGTDSALLEAENILRADAFVSLTGRDEENLLMAMQAQHSGVGKVLAKMNRPNYTSCVEGMGLSSIISPKDIVAAQITRYVRALAGGEGCAVERLYKMLGGEVEALEFIVNETSPMIGVPLKQLHLRKGILLAAVARGSDIMIPNGNTALQKGDRIVVVSRAAGLKDLSDILA